MTHKELSNFTHAELSACRNFELTMKSLKEISKQLRPEQQTLPADISSEAESTIKKFHIPVNIPIKDIAGFLYLANQSITFLKHITGKEDLLSALTEIGKRIISCFS